jgi:hypothetical protein
LVCCGLTCVTFWVSEIEVPSIIQRLQVLARLGIASLDRLLAATVLLFILRI